MILRLLIFSAALALSTSLLATEIGEKMPDCSLIKVNDAQHFKLQKTHDKVLYVDFWASWCPPCAQSFPFMNELNRDFKAKGLQVIAINMDQSLEDTKTFLTKYPANFTVMTDINEQCAKSFDLKAMPSSYLVDRNGVIRYTHLGFRTDDTKEIRALIEQLIAEQP
ncbi:MAG: TlpA family protein disulfide reductase [Methylococcales bacterium]|nr:MAG: TlpA family protein disulfide reductase [Methylococcales bacterium]